ncbi:homeobox-containing protein 1-like [Mizuhopecten yessoensis]|uniref:Homeobox-containing protein 1 n=1 Tax=Mizuhopecten yessoensis TaxID=6573 RepID=A0A210PY85_MIZYE|nr:homeobox-containing protein 1-like [Mizuhopecten yessoensis]OWF41409.1 Homeobox-containing protein 1 [Mizuhopecten yessoensis]
MSGRVGGGRQMFSIEQIELIRRLRNSGITKEEVAQAFDSFDRLDNELGLLYSVPVSLSQPAVPVRNHTHEPSHPRTPVSTIARTSHPGSIIGQGDHSSLSSTQANNVPASHQHNVPNFRSHPVPNPVYPVSMTANTRIHSQPAFPERQAPKRPRTETIDLVDDIDNTVTCVIDEENSNTSSASASNISEEIATELREFLKQGVQKAGDEVRWFVSQYNIQLGQIASMTGQTFATTTQFLQGEYSGIPQHCMQSVFAWYLTYKKTVSNSPPQPTSSSPGSTQSGALPMISQKVKLPDGQEIFIPHQRRERFTFREKHLEVLETCFNENAYPSHEQREAISHMCNMAVSNMGHRSLHDREKVTPHMVLNWFANRRKEVKKIAREEGIPESEVVLPSKVSKRPISFDISMEGVTLSPLEPSQDDVTDQTDEPDDRTSPSIKSEPG